MLTKVVIGYDYNLLDLIGVIFVGVLMLALVIFLFSFIIHLILEDRRDRKDRDKRGW